MEPVSTMLVAGLTTIATEAMKDGASSLAKTAWGKVKGAIGWTDDPPSVQVKSSLEKALQERPQLTTQLEIIVNDYTQQVRFSQSTSNIVNAGRDIVNIQGEKVNFGSGTRIGGS